MDPAAIFVACFLFNIAFCYDIESFESNGIEESPIYETIIFSDIADILNDLENNNVPYEKATNESESDEDVEDLLSEYHNYLEKAHKQRVNYLEKSKLKNKVPVIRHEKFSKLKSFEAGKHKDHYKNSYYNSDSRLPQQALNPFNMFIPYNSNKYLSTTEHNDGLNAFNNVAMAREVQLSPFPNYPVKTSCNNCKNGQGSCKQCSGQKTYPNMFLPLDEKSFISNPIADITDDTLNIRIKVEVQVPKGPVQKQFYNNQNKEKISYFDNGNSKEYLSAINLPSPYFNFPIPMNLFGYKRMSQLNKFDSVSPLHKLTMHKKKKSKVGSGNKKHRKKLITFHNIKIQPQSVQAQFGTFNVSENIINKNETVTGQITLNQTNYSQARNVSTPNPFENSTDTNQTEENIIFLVNITNNIENGTNEKYKTENSIETEYSNAIRNTTTDKPFHLIRKREVQHHNKSRVTKKPLIKKKNFTKVKNLTKTNATTTRLNKHNIKKIDRSLPPDTELLFWPNDTINKNKDHLRNITAIILESEHKREKLNVSADTLRHNHTRVLEQVIFGSSIDWNDVDSVAPAFISFFGKYIEGVMTFCSDRICHSMKCSKQNCINRVCMPRERFNNKGHCAGSNNTDSAASLESIMDLPSNIAFEIVDILKDRMIGKLYGKITICINTKCITFATSKKLYIKNKCNVKELSPKGHCVNSKEAKT